MDQAQQVIFLDIACFFKGSPKNVVVDILLSENFFDPYYDIEKLIDKCLIVVGEYDILMMHDLIQQMSLEIARQESKVPNKDAPEVLTRDTV